MKKLQLQGMVFGRLTVIEESDKDPRSGAIIWQCLCECGKTAFVRAGNLKGEQTTSCGCLHHEIVTVIRRTHGGTYKPEYSPWKAMHKRCSNRNDIHYYLYGGRGISVCETWKDFENFLADMGTRPSKAHSIERADGNGNYGPGNCKWATPTEQARNRRSLVGSVSVKGVSWNKRLEKFSAQITVGYHQIYLGVFASLNDAADARKQAEAKYWGKSE